MRWAPRSLAGTPGFECRSLGLTLVGDARSPGWVVYEARLTLDAGRGLLRPTTRTVIEELIPSTSLCVGLSLINTPASDGLDSGSHRSGDPYGVRIVPSPTLDAVAWGEESIKTLDEVRVTSEQLRDSVDYTGCVNARPH